MNRLVVFSLAVLLAPGGGLSAQQRDSMRQRGDTAEAERLRAQIEQRFSARVQHDLQLTQDQATKLRASQERFSARRRQVMQQQMQRHRALDDQMQPGVAANSDSVSKLMDGMRSGRAEGGGGPGGAGVGGGQGVGVGSSGDSRRSAPGDLADKGPVLANRAFSF